MPRVGREPEEEERAAGLGEVEDQDVEEVGGECGLRGWRGLVSV